MPFSPDSRLGDVLDSEAGRTVVLERLPMVAELPFPVQARHVTVRQLVDLSGLVRDDAAAQAALFAALAAVPDSPAPPPEPEPAVAPAAAYEPAEVPRASATLDAPASTACWSVFEAEIRGPAHGNPYVDVELSAEFTQGDRALRVPGFYDGDGIHRIRFMPDAEGAWEFRTHSNARSLDGLTGAFTCAIAATGDHGPVRVHDTFHFRHADGTRCLPLGTTAYAWTHQGEALEEQTLRTLADSGFTKLRMCVFPKSYLYNANEPEHYPFEGSLADGWDFTRPNPAFWRHLERRIADLGALGIEADLILFHAYDRWGFSDMGAAADDRYVRYAVARLAAFQNVWWALANEYDLLWSKRAEDWERFAGADRHSRSLRPPALEPQLPGVLRQPPPVDHAFERPARGRLPDRGEHGRVAPGVGQARGDRRVRLRGRHRPGLGQHQRRGDGAAVLGGRRARRLRRPRRDLPRRRRRAVVVQGRRAQGRQPAADRLPARDPRGRAGRSIRSRRSGTCPGAASRTSTTSPTSASPGRASATSRCARARPTGSRSSTPGT